MTVLIGTETPVGATTGAATKSNRAFAFRFKAEKEGTLEELRAKIEAGTASNVRLAIASDGTAGLVPGALIAESGLITIAAGEAVATGLSARLTKGLFYWLIVKGIGGNIKVKYHAASGGTASGESSECTLISSDLPGEEGAITGKDDKHWAVENHAPMAFWGNGTEGTFGAEHPLNLHAGAKLTFPAAAPPEYEDPPEAEIVYAVKLRVGARLAFALGHADTQTGTAVAHGSRVENYTARDTPTGHATTTGTAVSNFTVRDSPIGHASATGAAASSFTTRDTPAGHAGARGSSASNFTARDATIGHAPATGAAVEAYTVRDAQTGTATVHGTATTAAGHADTAVGTATATGTVIEVYTRQTGHLPADITLRVGPAALIDPRVGPAALLPLDVGPAARITIRMED